MSNLKIEMESKYDKFSIQYIAAVNYMPLPNRLKGDFQNILVVAKNLTFTVPFHIDFLNQQCPLITLIL